MVYTELQPDPNSPIWQLLRHHQNSYKFRFRRDQLYRGVCTTRCNELQRNRNDDDFQRTRNVSDVQPHSDNVEMSRRLYEISRNQKSISQYELQLHECVNEEFQKIYNLSVKTFVQYCESAEEPIEKGKLYEIV